MKTKQQHKIDKKNTDAAMHGKQENNLKALDDAGILKALNLTIEECRGSGSEGDSGVQHYLSLIAQRNDNASMILPNATVSKGGKLTRLMLSRFPFDSDKFVNENFDLAKCSPSARADIKTLTNDTERQQRRKKAYLANNMQMYMFRHWAREFVARKHEKMFFFDEAVKLPQKVKDYIDRVFTKDKMEIA